MAKKLRVAVLFGGRSAEHEISLISAKNVMDAMDRTKYEVVAIGIDKDGRWHQLDSQRAFLDAHDPKKVRISPSQGQLSLAPGPIGKEILAAPGGGVSPTGPIDVIFPVMHGTYGEDGTIQGVLKMADVPFVGAGILGSAVGMDKDVMKRLLRDGGVPISKFKTFRSHEIGKINYAELSKHLGLPMFVKPANTGSSVGVSKVRNEEELHAAVKKAFQFDTKLLIEEAVPGREIECSVIGNENPRASLPGEVIVHHDFYSYEAKYLDENGASLEIPAKLPDPVVREIQKTAIDAYKALECEGMGRVDFFVTKDNKIYVNEINTIPGFTKISMYPKMWEATGLSYADLVDELIRLAIERHERDRKIKTKFLE
ncbi:MAG: D-alanine--D-alanine ligase [Bdellovibrionales bacterium]|nr:D-alanine--D-alanine ligase [Bdellovibrionales bacterium]